MNEEQNDFARQRERMVQEQIAARGITDPALLNAFRQVPREHFVSPPYLKYAYRDGPIPLPGRQTISQPYVVALMISLMQLRETDRVLEIGTGSGYAAAVMSRMVAMVYTVERHERLVAYARQRLADLGYDNVVVHHGDGTLGWPEHAPYDGIVVAAGGPRVPPSLRRQLALNGRLVIPVGKRSGQMLVVVERTGEESFRQKKVSPVRFVPLVGEEGWQK